MSESSHLLWYMEEEQLIKLVGQGTYSGATNAWDRFTEIRGAGGDPKVFYSEHSGFTVLDDNDPDEMRRCMPMEQRAKRFRG